MVQLALPPQRLPSVNALSFIWKRFGCLTKNKKPLQIEEVSFKSFFPLLSSSLSIGMKLFFYLAPVLLHAVVALVAVVAAVADRGDLLNRELEQNLF